MVMLNLAMGGTPWGRGGPPLGDGRYDLLRSGDWYNVWTYDQLKRCPIHKIMAGMTSVCRKFAESMKSAGLQPGAPVAVALSGGSDSLALALLVAWWSRQTGEVW